ncbi:MAG: tetratricopeptide repeat protein, partial [Anaerolineales bacterium]
MVDSQAKTGFDAQIMEDRNKRYQDAMEQGHSAAWDQNWGQAVEHYRDAVRLAPGRAQAINNLGLAYFQLQKYKEAEMCYRQAAKLTPEDPLAVERLAQIYERTGRIKQAADYSMAAADLYLKIRDATKAIENWTRITQLIPEHIKAHSRLAIVHERLGNTKQAVREYISVAALLQNIGQVNEALGAVEKAVRIAPKDKEALQALDLVRSNKTLPKPKRQRGATGPLRMAGIREMDEEKKTEITHISDAGPDPITEARQQALTELAGLLFDVSSDDLDEEGGSWGANLRGVFGRSKADDLSAISKLLGSAIDLQTRAHHDEAARDLKKAVDLGLDVPATYFNLGLLYSRLQRPDRATRFLQRSINHPAYALASHLLIAQQYYLKERLQDAASEYLMALREADTAVVPDGIRESLSVQYEPMIETVLHEADTKTLAQWCANIDELLVRKNWRKQVMNARQQLPHSSVDLAPVPLAEIITEAKDTRIVEA